MARGLVEYMIGNGGALPLNFILIMVGKTTGAVQEGVA